MRVFHNWGRWIAYCSSPLCVGAEQVELDAATAVCRCRDQSICQHAFCGTVIELDWPDDPRAIEAVLAARPVGNRHWYSPETVEDLERENMEHSL